MARSPFLARRRPSTEAVPATSNRPALSIVPSPKPEPPRHGSARSMTASARPITLGDKSEGVRIAATRQEWQGEAWAYRRSLGELRYAVAYLGNAAQRMRIYPATVVEGDIVELDIADLKTPIMQDVIAACRMALAQLGTGPTGIAPLLKLIMENFEVAGECFLVGQDDPMTGVRTWRIRSTSETVVDPNSGKIGFRDLPSVSSSSVSNDPAAAVWVDPASSFVARMWWPDPEFSTIADSPFRAILDVFEELLLLGRDVRATARSRLANNGILGIPSEMTVVSQHATALDNEEPSFAEEFQETASAALRDESSAAAVVPIIIEGPGDKIAQIRYIPIDRAANKENMALRQELIQRIAIGIDLPSEVLTGKGEANHWTAWAISEDTFRDHIEPIVIAIVDALTQAYLWPTIEAAGVDPADAANVFLWYDPTELVTKPDRTADAFQAWDRGALSDEALLKYLGFPDTDMPDDAERIERLVLHAKTFAPEIQAVILNRIDPSLVIPASPTIPGEGPGQTPTITPPAAPAPTNVPPAAPATTPPVPPRPAAAAASTDRLYARIAAKAMTLAAQPAGATVPLRDAPIPATVPDDKRPARVAAANRQLVDIDRRLRDRLIVACNTAVKTALSRAGAKIVSKARTAAGASLRAAIIDVPSWQVPFAVGPALRAAAGLDERTILDSSLAELRTQWDAWVSTGQEQALRAAARIAGLDVNTAYAQFDARYGAKLSADRDAGWTVLEQSLRDRTTEILRTAPLDDLGDDITVDVSDRFVSAGVVRAALSIAGGFGRTADSSGVGTDGRPVDSSEPMGQIGTGDTVGSVLEDSGAQIEGYQWVHGPSANPFEPHEELDGVVFASFTGDELAVAEGVSWGGGFYAPGDHDGCLCDFMPVWTTLDEAVNADDA